MTTNNFFEIEKITNRTYMPAGIAGIPYFGSSHLKKKQAQEEIHSDIDSSACIDHTPAQVQIMWDSFQCKNVLW
jgi:hypothetical protein